MNRIKVLSWMDARWQDKLTGSNVSLDDVWKRRVIVIAWCEEVGYSNTQYTPPTQLNCRVASRRRCVRECAISSRRLPTGCGRQFGNWPNRLYSGLTTWILIDVCNFSTMTSLCRHLSPTVHEIGWQLMEFCVTLSHCIYFISFYLFYCVNHYWWIIDKIFDSNNDSSSQQESCAIAKMTAQCPHAPRAYIWVPWIFSGLPDYIRPRLLFPTFFMGIVPIEPVNVPTKFELGSFTSSWDNRGYPKNLGSPWIRPRSLFSKFLKGFYLDWPCKCTRQIWSP